MSKKVKNNEPLFAFGGCLKLILKLAFVFIVISLIWIYFFTPEETKEVNDTKADIVNNYDSTIYKSNDILRKLHNNKLQTSDAKELISQFSLVQLENIYYYLCAERFNSGNRPNYNNVAENLNISTSNLKAIDNYYSEEIFPSLKEVIRNIYKNNPNLELDYYNPLVPTGYCGLYTFIAGIKVYGSKRDTNFESQAKSIVTQIAQNLPSWITGFKFHYTIYIDKPLETKGDIDLGFLWRKGDKILIMDASTRDYSYQDPLRNLNWNTNEWNNKKYVNHSNSRIDLELK